MMRLSILLAIALQQAQVLFAQSTPKSEQPKPGTVQIARDSATSDTEEQPVILQDFHRSKNKNGKIVWEAKGKKAYYYPVKGYVAVFAGTVTMLAKNNKLVKMTAQKADLYIKNSELVKVVASDDVKIVYEDDYTLTTGSLTLHQDSGNVQAPGDVHITGKRIDIVGKMLSGNIREQIFNLKKNVRTLIKPLKNHA